MTTSCRVTLDFNEPVSVLVTTLEADFVAVQSSHSPLPGMQSACHLALLWSVLWFMPCFAPFDNTDLKTTPKQ